MGLQLVFCLGPPSAAGAFPIQFREVELCGATPSELDWPEVEWHPLMSGDLEQHLANHHAQLQRRAVFIGVSEAGASYELLTTFLDALLRAGIDSLVMNDLEYLCEW